MDWIIGLQKAVDYYISPALPNQIQGVILKEVGGRLPLILGIQCGVKDDGSIGHFGNPHNFFSGFRALFSSDPCRDPVAHGGDGDP